MDFSISFSGGFGGFIMAASRIGDLSGIRIGSGKICKKGGEPIGKRQKTKKQLVEEFYRKESKMSPELGTELGEGDTIELNVPYEIVNVEDNVTTEVRMLQGVRVEFVSVTGEVARIMCWKRATVGKGSKLGSMMVLLGTNTDDWLYRWVIFRDWVQGKRIVELANPPKEKAKPKATRLPE